VIGLGPLSDRMKTAARWHRSSQKREFSPKTGVR